MKTTIGWPSSIRRVKSAWSAADSRGSIDIPNRLVSMSGARWPRPSASSHRDEPGADIGVLPALRVRPRVVGRHLHRVVHFPPGVDITARGEMDLGVNFGARPRAMVGHRHVEELVGRHVEAASLELVEQAEAGTADVGGVAPTNEIRPVLARGRTGAGHDSVEGRGGERTDRLAEPLLGMVGAGEVDRRRERGDERDHARGERDPGHEPTGGSRLAAFPPGEDGPQHGPHHDRRDPPGPEREIEPRSSEDAGHRHHTQREGHTDDHVQ